MKANMIVFTAAIAAVMTFTSCNSEDDGLGGNFNAVLGSNPQNLDPQLASDKESFFVIRNIYATLMDMDSNGSIVNGAAQSYSVSKDGLVYTFKLRDGLVWYGLNSEESVPLTAYDYEYAFKRIFDPDTHSPHTKQFSIIKNSLAVYGGAVSDSEFGVHADDDLTLTIELEYPNCDFLKLLAHPAASPCNEELFLSTQGRYGLSARDTYACGAFYVTDWNYDPYWTDNHITLEKIDDNSMEGYITYPDLVQIEITDDRIAFESKNNVQTDGYVIRDIAQYDKNVQKDYLYREYIDGTSFLFFSPESPIAEDENARKALAVVIDRKKLEDDLSENSLPASRILPHAITIVNKSFRELTPDRGVVDYSVNPQQLWDDFTAAHENTDFNSYTLLVCDSYNSEMIPYSIIEDFEKELDFYCMPVFENESDFNKKLSNMEYDLCIGTVYTDYNLAESYINAVMLYADIKDGVLNQNTLQAAKSVDLSAKKDIVSSTEKYFSDKVFALPLSYEKKYLVYRDNADDLWYDPFNDVIFYKYAKQF